MSKPQHSIALANKDDTGITKCPTCGHPVRRIYRGKHLDHYKPAVMQFDWEAEELEPVDRFTANKLRKLRKGKKTVAMVGMAVTTCALAPFEDKDVEIWAFNEMHHWKWLKRADRWFQIHATKSWQRDIAKRNVHGHREWLQENPLDIPIYMQYWNENIPKSVAYPLREVCALAFKNIRRGDAKIKYFTSTFAYMMGIAILEGRNSSKPDKKPFDRIEIYGFEMASNDEFVKQKACAEWWKGLAMGMGIEIYLPPNCIMMLSDLYGGSEQGAGWMGK